MLAADTIATLCSPIDAEATDALPPAIQSSLVRHRENLASMVAALQAVGMDDAAVEAHLSVVIASYRAELSAALHHIGNQG